MRNYTGSTNYHGGNNGIYAPKGTFMQAPVMPQRSYGPSVNNYQRDLRALEEIRSRYRQAAQKETA